jgi:Fe-S-cluster containining protein
MKKIECHKGCGACCIAPSISSPIPGMPGGKPAGLRCPHLTDDYLCGLYGRPERPGVCFTLQADQEWCGVSRSDAMMRIASLEAMTL